MRERLVERARGGDESAFTKLVDLEGDRCYAIAYRILRDRSRGQTSLNRPARPSYRHAPGALARDRARRQSILRPRGQLHRRGR
jgi:hypothetical protein